MTPRRLAYRLIAAGWLLFGACLGARAEPAHHILWEVKGKHNTVYLLGSVHMLKAGDSALPSEAMHAYAASKILVMELDLNGAGADSLLDSSGELESLPEGQLESLAQSGFDSAAGVDEQFALLAQEDQKPIIGLETIDEQLGFFAHLSLEQQREFLRTTLEDSASVQSETDAVVRAWQRGDTGKLEQLLRTGSNESPELYRLLTTERNRRWLPKITQLLSADDNYLVIVGALHLIGHDGVIDLLQRQGYTAVQE